jgi:capsular polysaccharide biosynthesis protein
VIGEGNHHTLKGTSRAIFVACLTDARVRARSGFIEARDLALLDYQGDELARIDDELDFDPAVFHAEGGAVWITGPQDDASAIEIDEAFTLLGPHTDDFGHWILDLLPRFIAASMSGALPSVPMLIDESMTATQRESLELMLPGRKIIVLPAYATARVRRLWVASSQLYFPVLEKLNERFRWDYIVAPPRRFAEIVREMARRVAHISEKPTGQDRVFLARKPFLCRKLVNHLEIEIAAKSRDFVIVYPEDLSFAEQVRLMRHARFVAGPDGSALLLAHFSQAGTKICHLCHPFTVGLPHQTGTLSEIGIDVTVLTGPYSGIDEEYPDQSNYMIDAVAFGEFLDKQLGGE